MTSPLAVVTGSAGFVGRHMVAELEARGYTVIGVDPAHGLESCSVRLGYDCRTWFSRAAGRPGVDLVVHCAAVVGGRTMIDGAPLQLAAEDLSIDADLFRWLLTLPGTPPKVVYFSSSAAYPVGYQRGWPAGPVDRQLRERDINLANLMLPDQTYGWVKLTGERLAAEAQAIGLPVYVFRPFSGYGADQDPAYPFPAFIARALAKEDPFTVWGPGTQVRDFVHIDDVVATVLARLDGDNTAPLNICTGVGTSFLRLAEAVCRLAGYAPEIVTDPSKPVGVQSRIGDPTLMREVRPAEVPLMTGILDALAGRP